MKNYKIANVLFRTLRPFVHFYTDKRRCQEIIRLIREKIPSALEVDLKDKVVLDLGANRGDFTIALASLGPRIWAFEPNRIAFNYAQKRLFNLSNVNLLNVAISDKSEITNIYSHNNSSQDPLGFSISSSMMESKVNLNLDNPEQILTINFDEFISKFPEIYILKVDIEGAEVKIWNTIANNSHKIRYLLIEVHDQVNPGLRDDIETFIKLKFLQQSWRSDWI